MTLWTALEDWTFALVTAAATFVLVPLAESILRRISRKQAAPWQILLSDVVTPLSRLIYPIGLRVFIDAAPIGSKTLAWLEHADFLLFVIILVELVRRTALWSIAWLASLQRTRNTEMALEHGFIPLLRNVVTLLVLLSGGITILKHFGYDVMSLVAALGVGSLAIGLAAKDTLSNMISGFILIIDRNLRPGDRISIGGGTVGLVQEIGLRSTRMDLRDGNIMIVPNQDLVNSRIVNLSMTKNQFNASTRFRVPLSTPFERIRAIALEAIAATPKAQKGRAGWDFLNSVADGHQLISAGFGIADPDDSAEAISQFHTALVDRLAREKIPLLGDPATLQRTFL
jgi:MscS family membrane protein